VRRWKRARVRFFVSRLAHLVGSTVILEVVSRADFQSRFAVRLLWSGA